MSGSGQRLFGLRKPPWLSRSILLDIFAFDRGNQFVKGLERGPCPGMNLR